MAARKSYYIRSEGADENSIRSAIRWLLAEMQDVGFIAVIQYRNLEDAIARVLGEGAVKELKKNGEIEIEGKRIILVTRARKLYNGEDSPLVAFYPDSKFLDELDSIPKLYALLVVPWMLSEVEPWIRARNATELGQPATPAVPLVRSRVVEEALKDLTNKVNVSTGVGDPKDRAAAVQVFDILLAAHEPFAPDEIKAWLIANGEWKADDAQEVADLAEAVIQGRRLRRGSKQWPADILDQWRASAR